MAGDWIKMRSDLFTHPKVVRITSALKADRLRTVGGLMSVWCLFDTHSIDGHLDGYNLEAVDEMIGWPGFSAAMKTVGWLDEIPSGLILPEFGTHNGQSAKRRAQDSDRKKVSRMSAYDADEKRTREEKRREELTDSSGIAKSVESRGSRLPPTWEPSEEDIGFCKKERPDLLWREVAIQFRDFWIAKTGANATKKDWAATWRTWVRRQDAGRSSANWRQDDANFLAQMTGRNESERDNGSFIDV